MQNDMKEEESFLIDWKAYLSVEALMNDYHEGEGHLVLF